MSSSVRIIRALLFAHSPFTDHCPAARVYTGFIPTNSALPALAIMQVNSIPSQVAFSDEVASDMIKSRVSLRVRGADYSELANVCESIKTACKRQRGDIAGVRVVLVQWLLDGPDMSSGDGQLGAARTIDFEVIYYE